MQPLSPSTAQSLLVSKSGGGVRGAGGGNIGGGLGGGGVGGGSNGDGGGEGGMRGGGGGGLVSVTARRAVLNNVYWSSRIGAAVDSATHTCRSRVLSATLRGMLDAHDLVKSRLQVNDSFTLKI